MSSRLMGDLLSEAVKKDGCRICVDNGKDIPDLLLVDYNNIKEAQSSLWSGAKIVLIDTGIKKEDIAEIFRSYRVDGIISKNTDIKHFKKALRAVYKGKKWLYLDINEFIQMPPIGLKKPEDISKREREVVDLVCKGFTNKEIASNLSLSEHTVKAHISRIFRKFNVSNRSQLVALFMKK